MRAVKSSSISLLLVAGGTGGHILPAVAFGDWILREQKGVTVNYISGSRPMELEIYRVSGIEPFVIRIAGSPVGASFAKKLKRWFDMLISIYQVWRCVNKKSPDLCVMFGGYVSIPALLICRLKGVRSVFHEQNARAGKATRLAHRFNVRVASGWEECAPLKSGDYERVGVPIRRFRDMRRDEALELLDIVDDGFRGPVVSVMTGSLGSGHLAETLSSLSRMELFSLWRFLVVNPEVDSPTEVRHNMIHVPRMWDISPLYALSDMLITRAGASTLSEVEALTIPAVLVPWRGAADDHQMKNAQQLASVPTVRIWDESSESLSDLASKLNDLYRICLSEDNHTVKRLYNASKAGEKICGKLWDFAAYYMKGEVNFEGRRLH
ncbi:MAG: UDP-N-acetylglucosamine--N-acetylmuramyl-(pentapeptide) pyrophosphoryl-undecaprenol N-acetylglucosamine transferase [Synergistaceae bacterium]|jgi:UDP-N-acetylglucosamine--N-acetylmuramyl-(pentapeptide) pyrophosphoryl-undecaprenol N-acetylglucosamine transferase|nr:UDP-N-acetylglucosamine--N-acetylmuramyl-(pentapeptide) pyrophosphoryl-undecaprenol N-acetylglucosamine transferase [Synergistaceae bacterium]